MLHQKNRKGKVFFNFPEKPNEMANKFNRINVLKHLNQLITTSYQGSISNKLEIKQKREEYVHNPASQSHIIYLNNYLI